MTASVASSIFGSGRSSTRTSPGQYMLTPRIVSPSIGSNTVLHCQISPPCKHKDIAKLRGRPYGCPFYSDASDVNHHSSSARRDSFVLRSCYEWLTPGDWAHGC